MAKTIEEITAALQAIVDEANGEALTDDQCNRYESLEAELATAKRSAEIEKRNAAYKSVATPVLTGVAAKQDDTLERAFDHYMRTGQENSDIVELRAQSEGTAAAGGYTVPDGFRNKLVDRMKAFGGLANAVETITTSGGNTLEWPTIDDTSNVGEIVAENGAPAGGADLVFGSAQLGAYKYMSVGASGQPLKVSWELLQDTAVPLEQIIGGKLGQRIARAQAPHLVSGTGSGQPKGIITGKTPVEIGALTYANLLSIVHSVDPAYRENAVWSFNDATLMALRGVVDESTGRPLLTDGNLSDSLGGSRLLGFPVVIDQAFSTYAAADDDPAVGVFGDLREGYVIRRVKDITIVRMNETFALNAQVGFVAWARMDATIQNPNSYVTFSGAVA